MLLPVLPFFRLSRVVPPLTPVPTCNKPPPQEAMPPRMRGQTPRAQRTSMPGDVPTAVRNLLLATKQLQDALYQWSIGQLSETDVSDIYVRIGTDFNYTLHAFAYHSIDMSDIHSIPKDLRDVLERCLGEDPSAEILAIYMPEVRQVLYRLLRGLQAKQHVWKAVSREELGTPPRY